MGGLELARYGRPWGCRSLSKGTGGQSLWSEASESTSQLGTILLHPTGPLRQHPQGRGWEGAFWARALSSPLLGNYQILVLAFQPRQKCTQSSPGLTSAPSHLGLLSE